jgi:2-hydroxychromene-2-carboxylate isomerase
MTTLEFFYDYASPYSYLADTQVEALTERTGAELVYRPILLGAVFKATGNRSPIQEPVEAKRRHSSFDIPRWAAYYGVPLRFNPHFPINTLTLMRLAHAAQRANVFAPFHRAAFSAMWEQERDMGNPEVVAEVLEEAGLDARALLEAAQDPEIKQALKQATEEAIELGAFGVPTFRVGDELFFGNDRLPLVEAALTRAA